MSVDTNFILDDARHLILFPNGDPIILNEDRQTRSPTLVANAKWFGKKDADEIKEADILDLSWWRKNV